MGSSNLEGAILIRFAHILTMFMNKATTAALLKIALRLATGSIRCANAEKGVFGLPKIRRSTK